MSKARNLATFGSTKSGHISGDSATFTDTVTASAFVGSGASLTGVHDSVAVQAQIDSAAVTLTGDQTIAGTKTFSSTPKSLNAFEAASAYRFTKSTTSGVDNALYYDSDNLYVGRDVKNLRFRTNFGTVGMAIDSASNVGIGNAAPDALLDVRNGTAYTSPDDFLAKVQQNTNATGKNGLSVMNAWASNTSTIFECAMGWDGASTGYYPVVTVDGLGQTTFLPQRSEKVRIDADGLKFNGDTAAANALDDYEEGIWSPTFTDGTNSATSYTTQTGRYIKIGSQVTVMFDVVVSNFGSVSGAVYIGNLPFTINSYYWQGTLDMFGLASTLTSGQQCLQALPNTDRVYILHAAGLTTGHSVTNRNSFDSGTTIRGTITYETT